MIFIFYIIKLKLVFAMYVIQCLHKIWFFINLHFVPVESGLGQKYAFIKKSTIFIRSLRNFDKRRYSWVDRVPCCPTILQNHCNVENGLRNPKNIEFYKYMKVKSVDGCCSGCLLFTLVITLFTFTNSSRPWT